MKTSFTSYALLTLLLTVLAFAGELKNPAPPAAKVVGNAGKRTLCYWVFAESAEKAQQHWYLQGIPGKVTALSASRVVMNAPDTLDANNKVVLTLQPVEGAVRYHIFRTEELPAPKLTVTAKKAAKDTFYYWVQGHNGWRHSQLAGPFPVKCDVNDFENTITVAPSSPLQTDHSTWVTKTPQPPVGRKPQVIGMRRSYSPVKHTSEWAAKYREFAAWGPGPEPVTVPSETPYGTGKFWIGSTTELTFEDAGQEAKEQQAPTVNETPALTIDDMFKPQSSRFVHQGIARRIDFNGHSSMGANFYGGFFPNEIEMFVSRGGVNYYQNQPGAYPGYKSTFGLANWMMTSFTESQHVGFNASVTSHGMGDTIAMGANLVLNGGNRDSGDEGAEIMRASVDRQVTETKSTLIADAPVGATHLSATGLQGGAGRTVINLTQARGNGRIDHVNNCDIFGEGTNWTPQMLGWYISFDVDSEKTTRFWYQVMDVVSPTHLKIRLWTNWRFDCNLGYSRFIYNPGKGQKLPNVAKKGLTVGSVEKDPYKLDPLYTNRLAIGVLPKEREKAAGEGKYLIAPGTTLADPWNEGGLHVESLAQPWKKGDSIAVVAGHSQPITYWWGLLSGTLSPQDRVEGIAMMNFTNRTANGNAFSAQNFQMGMHINLPDKREGNGVIVSGEPVDAAYLAAPDVPMLRCYNTPIPFIQGSEKRNALEIVSPTGERPLSVSKDVVSINGALKGSAQTRGESLLSGNGKQKQFTITFAKPHAVKPVVLISTNQFARCRLVTVTAKGFTVEFEEAPKAGKNNVTVWWMAQE
ncbi:MAG: H-type lectin domain-containing protein [Armatimonadota bacterium]